MSHSDAPSQPDLVRQAGRLRFSLRALIILVACWAAVLAWIGPVARGAVPALLASARRAIPLAEAFAGVELFRAANLRSAEVAVAAIDTTPPPDQPSDP